MTITILPVPSRWNTESISQLRRLAVRGAMIIGIGTFQQLPEDALPEHASTIIVMGQEKISTDDCFAACESVADAVHLARERGHENVLILGGRRMRIAARACEKQLQFAES